MIRCYAKNERPMDALELFREMVGWPNCGGPNPVTTVGLLKACGALSALGQGRVLHGHILRKGLDSIISVINSLVMMYVQCGSLAAARWVFERMSRRDVVSWNSMISDFEVHRSGREAIWVFEIMIAAGFEPNHIIFIGILGACSHVGLVEEGKALFQSMIHKHDIVPCVEHYLCLVDLLGHTGQLDEAVKIIEMMRIEPDPDIWGALLGACRIDGNVEPAERASVRLFELDQLNVCNYVLLADIYAEANMWEDVHRVKRLLEAQGLLKKPGSSWIEVKKKVCSLVSVDELNPQVEQLHSLLVKLSTEMKDPGYVPGMKVVLYELDKNEEQILLGHSEKLAVAFGLINSKNGETIKITKNLRLCEDCHSVIKFISKFTDWENIVRDVNRFHHFRYGMCSCSDYW